VQVLRLDVIEKVDIGTKFVGEVCRSSDAVVLRIYEVEYSIIPSPMFGLERASATVIPRGAVSQTLFCGGW